MWKFCAKCTQQKKDDGSYETYQIPFRQSTVSKALCSNSAYITKPGTSGNKAGEYIEVELLVDEAYLSKEE